MVCLSMILLCYRVTCLLFCNERFCSQKGIICARDIYIFNQPLVSFIFQKFAWLANLFSLTWHLPMLSESWGSVRGSVRVLRSTPTCCAQFDPIALWWCVPILISLAQAPIPGLVNCPWVGENEQFSFAFSDHLQSPLVPPHVLSTFPKKSEPRID